MSARAANVAQRLDSLEIGPFHWRLLGLIGGGMFFDAFDNFLSGSVLGRAGAPGAVRHPHERPFHIDGVRRAHARRVVGRHRGRPVRPPLFSYQFNLLVFGVTSLAASLAPSMTWLIVLRFVMGIGLGAEIVVGYSTLSEFMPAHARGRSRRC